MLNSQPHAVVQYIDTGKGRGVESERRLEGQQFTKLGRKYQHDYKLWKTCRKVPLQVNFLDDNILHCLLCLLSFYGYGTEVNLEHIYQHSSWNLLGVKYRVDDGIYPVFSSIYPVSMLDAYQYKE